MLRKSVNKQKGGIGETFRSPKDKLFFVSLFKNFLTLDNEGHSAAERHGNHKQHDRATVKWKDVLTGQWNGPDPVLYWSHGSVCVFPQDKTSPIWVPERLTRPVPTLPTSKSDQQNEDAEHTPLASMHKTTGKKRWGEV